MDFKNIAYLKEGNETQRRAHGVLTSEGLMGRLSGFDPILVGTVPINIDVDGSDLDIICRYDDRESFVRHVSACFSDRENFRLTENASSVTAGFFTGGFEIEIFAQPIPTEEQYGYRHMLVEHRLLQEKGEAFRQAVVHLKKQGLKTEPAFAQLLGLEGNAYEALLME